MTKLIVVSNRVAVPGSQKNAGGLATALEAVLRETKGVWVGWNGSVNPNAHYENDNQASCTTARGVDYLTFDLSEAEYNNYYEGLANSVLWPALHYREDLIRYSSDMVTEYHRVNNRFADFTTKILSQDDIIWVHDYHLFCLGKALRRKGVANRLGFFLHVPFPPPEIIEALPSGLDLAAALASYDVIGVQTRRDAENIERYLNLKLAQDFRPPHVLNNIRTPLVKVCPVGVSAELLSRAGRRSVEEIDTKLASAGLSRRALMVSVERLDYSKGIPHRLSAYENFLSNHPDWKKRVSLLQLAPLSREGIDEYRVLAQSVDTLVGQINGRHGDIDWCPVHYTNKLATPFALAGIFRRARVGLVTPMRDGMNLVAKEYIASQDSSDPGVLILSKFAGASEQLSAALIVDPRETASVVFAIKSALEMPLGERSRRHQELMRNVADQNVQKWCAAFIAALVGDRSGSGIFRSC